MSFQATRQRRDSLRHWIASAQFGRCPRTRGNRTVLRRNVAGAMRYGARWLKTMLKFVGSTFAKVLQ
jgi:hypothetical protein